MKRKMIITMVLTLCSLKVFYGQSFLDSFVVNPKVGIYTLAGDGGLVGGVELHTTFRGIIYSIDYYYLEEFGIAFMDSPTEYSNQIGLMIGKSVGSDYFRLQAQGGIAPYRGLRRTTLKQKGWFSDEYNFEKYTTAGFVFKLGFKFVPGSSIAIGFDVQANINNKNSVIMPMLSIELGNVGKAKTKKR